jgi:hypothetical protein
METRHLNKRIKERTGLPKKAHKSFLKRILKSGLKVADVKSKSILYYYVMGLIKKGYDIIIYNPYLLIVSNDTGMGITILNLPKEYQKIVLSINKKRGEHGWTN